MDNFYDWSLYFKEAINNLNGLVKDIANAEIYDDFFDFSELSSDMIYNFLFQGKNFCGFKKYFYSLDIFRETNFDFYGDFVGKCQTKNTFYGLYEISNASEYFSLLVKCLLYKRLNYEFQFDIEKDSNNEIDFTDNIISMQEQDGTCLMFRGQQKYAWDLTPSLIRDLVLPKRKGLFLDAKSLRFLYNEGGISDSLLAKYERCFGSDPFNPNSVINYRLLAWMQHAVSYSPLLDFTSSYPVALSFAIKENNPGNFLYDDSAIYILKLSKNDEIKQDKENYVDQILNSMYVAVLKSKIKPGSYLTIHDYLNVKHDLDFSTYENILKCLMPKYIFIDIPTHDRMIRQKGKFVLFYDYVSIKGKMFPITENMMYIHKHKINVEDKPKLLAYIRQKWPDIKNSYLMDPYSIFND